MTRSFVLALALFSAHSAIAQSASITGLGANAVTFQLSAIGFLGEAPFQTGFDRRGILFAAPPALKPVAFHALDHLA